MSYVRFGEQGSDVYVFPTFSGVECCGCSLTGESLLCRDPASALEHLDEHVRAGHVVPERALERLRREANKPTNLREVP